MRFINLFQVKSFLAYYRSAKTVHSIHSPFVYELLMHTLEDSRQYYSLVELEALRSTLLENDSSVQVEDHGAGSKTTAQSQRKISQIASTAVSNKEKAAFLFKLVNHLKPKHILELGSSLGLSSLYLHYARRQAKIQTIEGSEAIGTIAKNIHRQLSATIELHIGTFQEVLPEILSADDPIDLVYIDGHHSYEATLWHHEVLKPYLSDRAVLIYDDIYWSEGMARAWEEINTDPAFSICLDLYQFGILIKNREQKQRLSETIIKKKWKPFSLGFFG